MKRIEKSGHEAVESVLAGKANELTHDEMLRGQALSMACNYYVKTIVDNGDLYREMVRDNKVLKPATYTAVIEVALAFELFLAGRLREMAGGVVEYQHKTDIPAEEQTASPEVQS